MRLGQNTRLEAKDRAVGLLDGDPHGHGTRRRVDDIAERPHGEDCRSKAGVEDRRHPGGDERQTVVGVHGWRALLMRARS